MNKIYSTAYLMGGLGNQMFQIAHATAQGIKHNVEPAFIMDAYIQYENWKPTVYSNNIFKKINFVNEIPNIIRVSEETFNEPNLNFEFNNSIEFFGYFQSDKNFLGYDNEIRELFSPDLNFVNKMEHLYPEIKNKKTVSLHIRRCDYLQVNTILPVVDISYIDSAIKYVGDYDTLFVFSDDKQWTRENIKYPNSIIVDGIENYEELWLMSMCKDNIISNSTFSWWGSFLNKNIDKKVFCPSIWFGTDGPYPYDNIFQKDWNKIEVEYINGMLIKNNF